MSMKFIIIYICVFCSLIFSKEFTLSEKESSKSIIVFNSDKIEKNFRSIEKIENIDNLKSSFYYHIKDGYDIEVELKYDSVTSVNINDIIINNESSLLSNTLEVFSSEKVTLSDINGCVNTSDDEILVNVLNTPIASFDYVVSDNDIFQSQISFINNSIFKCF